MHLIGLDRAQLFMRYPDPLSPEDNACLQALIERRASGEPVAYLIASREFMGIDFYVDRRVLIPRPETEGLVERALKWIERQERQLRILDVGTGSGAIAISLDRLGRTTPGKTIIGCDVSTAALEVARINVLRQDARHVQLVAGSLLTWTRRPFDLIVANLPYLREEQRHPGIRWEPDSALYAAHCGFALYEELLRQSSSVLASGGILLCEIGPEQRSIALERAHDAHPSGVVRVEPDLAGLDRYLIIERPFV